MEHQGVSLDDFKMGSLLGYGSTSRVFLAQKKGGRDDGIYYAIRVIGKEHAFKDERSIKSIWARRNNLIRFKDSPLIIKLKYIFQDEGNIYFITNFVQRGNLRLKLDNGFTLNAQYIPILIAELVIAIETMHLQNIWHGYLNPADIMLGDDGHLLLKDFGLSKFVMHDNEDGSISFKGLMEYMAPEVVTYRDQGFAADWWALGIIMVEIITSYPAFGFSGDDFDYGMTLKCRIEEMEPNLQQYVKDPDAADLISILLKKDPEDRSYSVANGAIRKHPFFKDINWESLKQKLIPGAFTPVDAHKPINLGDDFNIGYHNSFSVPIPDDKINAFTGIEYISPDL